MISTQNNNPKTSYIPPEIKIVLRRRFTSRSSVLTRWSYIGRRCSKSITKAFTASYHFSISIPIIFFSCQCEIPKQVRRVPFVRPSISALKFIILECTLRHPCLATLHQITHPMTPNSTFIYINFVTRCLPSCFCLPPENLSDWGGR